MAGYNPILRILERVHKINGRMSSSEKGVLVLAEPIAVAESLGTNRGPESNTRKVVRPGHWKEDYDPTFRVSEEKHKGSTAT